MIKKWFFQTAKEIYLIADKECHDWSGYDCVGLPTLIVWSVAIPVVIWLMTK